MSPVRVTKMRWGWLRRNLLLILTFLGVLCGVTFGLGIRPLKPDETVILLLSYPGELFIRMLKLMILPLVIASLIAGSASLNAKANGRIIARTVSYFIVTSFLNAILGIILAITIHPGSPITKETLSKELALNGGPKKAVNILDGFLDLGRNIFPDNLFQASFQQVQTTYVRNEMAVVNGTLMGDNESFIRQVEYRAGTNTLGIIVFCLVFGTILGSMGKKGSVVVDFFTVIDAVILKIVTGIMWLSPLGVASVIMSKILNVNNLGTVISSLGLFIFTVVLGVFIWQLIFQNLIYVIIVRKNPFPFYFNLLEPWATAFATASTHVIVAANYVIHLHRAATLPITFRCMNDKCRVDPRISKFVLPIGATVNMDGTALFVAIGAIFIAQINECSLDFGSYAAIAVTATAASIASASVPSAALVLILIVLSAVNIPAGDVSLLFTIDWLVDRFRTTNNLLGDCYTAAVVEKWSKAELDAMDSPSRSIPENSPDDLEKVDECELLLVVKDNPLHVLNDSSIPKQETPKEVRIEMKETK